MVQGNYQEVYFSLVEKEKKDFIKNLSSQSDFFEEYDREAGILSMKASKYWVENTEEPWKSSSATDLARIFFP